MIRLKDGRELALFLSDLDENSCYFDMWQEIFKPLIKKKSIMVPY